ncbi:hypothetical protein SH591_00630 [Sphingomonas sp. LY54]|nr:hypothetical protein [Sphingomonas sp. LY54]WRP28729.1 hypothetical protein SH591_00630 [Sphingomonas sp. LY54]
MDDEYSFHVDDKGRVVAANDQERIVLGDERRVFAKLVELMGERDFES